MEREMKRIFMIKHKLIPALLILVPLMSASLFSQSKGTITGKVVDSSNGEELIGVNIFLEGTTLGAATDLNGSFIIRNVPDGNYSLIASMIGYSKVRITEINLSNEEVLKLDISLKSETYETDEVLVTAKLLLNNEAGLLKNRQKSTTISDVISTEQISRSGSSDAGDAMKKVVGSTVVDGKYVFVRGLGDRYSNTQLNGVELPSSDPNKKAFQLDLVPTNLLDNIITLKTFTPDKPGNFSGGLVDIGTKSYPEKFTMKISNSSNYNSQTTYNSKFITYAGGNTDWLGFDDGTRSVPDVLNDPSINIPRKQEARFNSEKASQLNAFSKSFSTAMNTKTSSVPFNQNLNLSVGDQLSLGEESKLGYLGSITYSRNFSFYDNGVVGRYTVSDLGANELNTQLLVNDSKGSSEANLGGLANITYNLNNNQQVGANIFYSKSGIATARKQFGIWPQEFGNEPNSPIFNNIAMSWIERDILNYQLRGQHFISELFNTTIDWTASFSNTNQDEPDYRLLSYSAQPTGTSTNYIIVGSGFDSPSRYFRFLEENSQNYNLNFSIPFAQWNGLSSKFKFGAAYQKTDRDFKERIFAYDASNQLFNQLNGNLDLFFAQENLGISSIDTLAGGNTLRYNFANVIRDNSRLKNNYSGDLEIFASYAMIEIPLLHQLKFIGGVRLETTNLNLYSADSTFENGRIDESDVLPSANLIYSITDNMNVRLSATQTLARPNFREIAPYSTKEFINDVELQGNPKLQRTLINNFDLRWEWFMNPGEVIAVSGFYKHLKNPIELSYAEGQTASNPIVQFNNVGKATIAGLEFELRLGLGKILNELSNFYVGSNLSLIYSNIDISESELAQRLAIDSSSSTTRVLQGQSPYVLNVDLSYINNDWGTTAGLYFNVFGERLSKVSANINPDVFEQPAPMLNLTISQKLISDFTLKLGAKNLLNSFYKEVSRFKEKDYTFYEYKSGITYSIGLSYGL
jgi:outer membrane receptor protein involved in Fe transport